MLATAGKTFQLLSISHSLMGFKRFKQHKHLLYQASHNRCDFTSREVPPQLSLWLIP